MLKVEGEGKRGREGDKRREEKRRHRIGYLEERNENYVRR